MLHRRQAAEAAMTTDQLLRSTMTNVRALFRQEPRLAGVTRHHLDLLLADFERDLRAALADLDAQTERDIELEIGWARQAWEEEQAEAKITKKQAKAKA